MATTPQHVDALLRPTWIVAACMIAGAAGCQVVCRGPACETAYPEGRVDLLGDLPLDGREVLIDDVARGAIVGSVVSGSRFSVAPTPDGLVVGEPEARTVHRLDLPEGPVADEESDLRWGSVNDEFGAALAVLPATDGIGWSLVVAAPGADRSRGVLRIYVDAADGVVEPALTLRGATQGDRFGERLRLCPDRSGDGLPELLVSAPWMQPHPDLSEDVPALAGVVALIDSDDLLAEAAGAGEVRPMLDVATAWWGVSRGDSLGVGLDCRTDFDGDGTFDIVLGAPQANDSAGQLYVLLSSDGFASGPVDEAARIDVGGASAETLGTSIASFTRPEGPQLLVGAPGFDAGRGAALWLDATDLLGVGLTERARVENDQENEDHVGRTVEVAELDGDGLPDLLIGGPDRRDGTLFDIGQIGVFRGNRALGDTTLAEADLLITDDQGFRRIGRRIVVHDVDEDGIDELLLPTRSPRTR